MAKGGNLYKSLNRSNFLSNVWDNIVSTVLGKRQQDKFGSKKKQDELPVAPEVQEEPIVPETGATQGIGAPPILPDQPPPSGQPEINEPYIPTGEGGSLPSGDPQQNKVFAPSIYIPQDKQSKTSKTPTGKIDTGGLKLTVGSKTPNQDANQQLTSDILDEIAYSSKFGQRGQNNINTLLNAVYPLSYQQSQAPPKFEKEQTFTDDKGKLWQYIFDPTSQQYTPIPVLNPQGQQMSTKLPEYDKSRIQPVTKDGKIVLKNLQSGEEVETGLTPEDYDYKFGLQKSAEEWNQEYDAMKLQLQAQKKGNGKGRGNGTGDGTSIGTGEIMVLDENNQPVDLGDAESPLGKLVQGLYSKNAKVREQSGTILRIYYPKFNVINIEKAGQLEDAIGDAYEQFKSGKYTQEQFQNYIKSLEDKSPKEMKSLRKKYGR